MRSTTFMQRVALLATCALAAHTASSASETLVGGGIYFDEVWTTEKSPYVLSKNVKVGPNTTVTVEPGVVIEGDGYELAVVGTFIINGKGQSGDDTTVKVRNLHVIAGKGESGGIDIASAEWSGGSILDADRHKGNKVWLNLRDSVVNGVPDIFLFFPTKDCAIERNVFVSSGGISAGTLGVEAKVVNNVFYMQTSDFAVKNWFKQPLIIEYPDTNRRPDVYPKDMIVKHNSFLCTDRVAIRMDPRYNDAQLRKAQENYFGTDDEELINAMIFDKNDDVYVNERVKFKPFLTKPHKDTPTKPRVNAQWCAASKL
mmetsp:Transcript_9826/g.14379  ORF Transcript_9826/g.14379 Transcript_9826/m.14379 type:complete len:314 (+) Transcript_9826:75-1016(+)